MLALESQVAGEIAGEIRVTLSAPDRARIRARSGSTWTLMTRISRAVTYISRTYQGDPGQGHRLISAGNRDRSELCSGPCRPRRLLLHGFQPVLPADGHDAQGQVGRSEGAQDRRYVGKGACHAGAGSVGLRI